MISASKHTEAPNPPQAACHGKEAFSTPQMAYFVMTQRKKARGEREVYRCEYCRRFHLGGRK